MIHTRSQQVIQINIENIENGTGLLLCAKINVLEISNNLIELKNDIFFCTILNNSEQLN